MKMALAGLFLTFLLIFPNVSMAGTIETSTVHQFPGGNYPTCISSSHWNDHRERALICMAEKTEPLVSLEWTTLINSSTMVSLSNNTEVIGDEVQNNLRLNTLQFYYDNLVFTCSMTSEAYPGISRNCSVTPNIKTSSCNQSTSTFPSAEVTVPSTYDSINRFNMSQSLIPASHHSTKNPGTASSSPVKTVRPITFPNNIVTTSAIAGTSTFAILILLITATICLLSRRKAKRREDRAASRDIHFGMCAIVPAPATETRCEANVYAEISRRGDGRSGTVPATRTADIGRRGPLQPPVPYAVASVLGLQQTSVTEYAVPDTASSRETGCDSPA